MSNIYIFEPTPKSLICLLKGLNFILKAGLWNLELLNLPVLPIIGTLFLISTSRNK